MVTDNIYYQQITKKKREATIVRSEIEQFTNQFFFNKDFIFVEPPVLHEAIKNKKLDIYLNRKYTLSSSNALFMGMYASEFNKVFTISKCFRNENDSLNHLIEFSVLEVEMLNCKLYDMLDIIKAYLEFIFKSLLKSKYIKLFPELIKRIKWIQNNFKPQIVTYDDFISSLRKKNYDKLKDISDIDYLAFKQLKKVVIVIDYPNRFATWTSKKKGNGRSIAMNILLPETYGELCEGCERTNNINLLQNKIWIAKADSIQWYVDSVKKIKTSRCGFGLGIDRFVRWIIGADKISDTRFFPRVKEENKDV